MTPNKPLPSPLRHAPFTTTTAGLHGVGEGRLRGRDLGRPFHGVRSPVPLISVAEFARALQARLPESAFFCSVTAALIMEIPLPWQLTADAGLHVGVPAPQRACRVAGVIGHKLQLEERDIRDWSGVRMTTPARTWCDLAPILALEDLVAAGDFLIGVRVRWRHPLALRSELEAMVARYPGRRGRGLLLEALPLLDENADSRPESIIRVTVARAGIPGLRANLEIKDAHGRTIAWGDLCFPAHRVIFEYQGEYHRAEAGRWRKDRTRAARLAAAGWHVIEIAADELHNRAVLLQLIRDALALYPARHPVDEAREHS